MTRWLPIRGLVVAALAAGCGGNAPPGTPGAVDDTVRVDVTENTIEVGGRHTPETMGDLLRRVTDAIDEGAEIRLLPGRYVLSAVEFVDSTCGNCENPAAMVPATYGLRLSGTRVRLVGAHADSVVIETNAGYGILFDDCRDCELRGITVTGGARDPDSRATDAAVVVRDSEVTLRDCVLRDNLGDSATVQQTVVGIAGIAGREGSYIDVEHCRIVRNSWDGIALYRGARARIHDNVIDGVDKARGGQSGGGRGVGIGLTWDAQADVIGNLVTRYWKGIGIFVDASATVRENVVEDVLTWGIAFWSAGRGMPVARIERNAVYLAGACGAMIAADPPPEPGPPPGAAPGDSATVAPREPLGEPVAPARGRFSENAIARATQDERYDSGEPYCAQRPLALEHVPPAFVVRDNLFFDSRQPGDAPAVEQLSRAEFTAAVQPLVTALGAWQATRASRFVRDFGP